MQQPHKLWLCTWFETLWDCSIFEKLIATAVENGLTRIKLKHGDLPSYIYTFRMNQLQCWNLISPGRGKNITDKAFLRWPFIYSRNSLISSFSFTSFFYSAKMSAKIKPKLVYRMQHNEIAWNFVSHEHFFVFSFRVNYCRIFGRSNDVEKHEDHPQNGLKKHTLKRSCLFSFVEEITSQFAYRTWESCWIHETSCFLKVVN